MAQQILLIPAILLLLLLVACAGQVSQEVQATEQTTPQEAEVEKGTATNGGEEASGLYRPKD